MRRYTPRQAYALLIVNHSLENKERAHTLALTALAAQGDGKTIKKEIKALMDGKR